MAAGIVASCGSDSTSPKPTSASGLTIDAGANATDSIGAEFAQALVVEVHKAGGAVVSGAVVRFSALPNDSLPFATAIQVASLTSENFSSFATDSTETHGHASVLVKLGSVAGKAGIAIAVPELGFVDTAWYTVKPGQPAQFALGVSDTVVIKGGTWDIGARVMDRAGNPLHSDSVSYTSLNSDATVTATGHATASTEGRAEIDVHYGTAHDTARASIVPPGVLAAVEPGVGVYSVNLDGTAFKKLTALTDYSVFPQWSPDGKRITIYEGNPYDAVILTAISPVDGTRTSIVPMPATLLGGLAWVRPDMNGLLYFSGPRADTHVMAIWRTNADGTGLVQLVAPVNANDFTHPAPSPDGKTVLYDFDPQGIIVLDVTSGTTHALGLQGYYPVYSPDGTHIAYVTSSSLMIANSDGSSARVLSTSTALDQLMAPSWSADGKWILTPQPSQAAALVRVSDGVVLPLPFATNLRQLALH